MRWLKFRFDPGELGSPGSFPWQAWPEKTGRRVTVYDANGEIVLVIDDAPRERAIVMGRLLEQVSWAAREDVALQRQCKNIAKTLSEGRLWQADEQSGVSWWARLRRTFRSRRRG